MSTEYYSGCPRCAARLKEEKNRAKKDLENAYGKMPMDEFIEFREKCLGVIHREFPSTLAEYYDIDTIKYGGVWSGLLSIHFWCRCKECGYKAEFSSTIPVQEVK